MASEVKQISFRLPWFRKRFRDKANAVAKVLLERSRVPLEAGKCPMTGEFLEDLEEFSFLRDP